MKHCGTKRIETPRLLLRQFTLEDAEAMYKNWASDPEVTKFLTWPPHESVEVSRRVLEDWAAAYAEPTNYQWAIVLKEINEPVGSISAVKLMEDVRGVRLGYCIGQRWWRRGITSEALGAVMDFFFDSVGAERIEAQHDPENPHSGMVMRHCGMVYEGTLRRAAVSNLGIRDVCCCAALRSDRNKTRGDA